MMAIIILTVLIGLPLAALMLFAFMLALAGRVFYRLELGGRGSPHRYSVHGGE